MKRRGLLGLGASALIGLALGGCASMNQFTADVASFGDWPAGRAPGSYAFDRMPSQQARAEQQQALEEAAAAALARAGFQAVAAGAQPDVLVQLGARVARAERSPWDDPLWWRGGFGVWHRGVWRGPYWGLNYRYENTRYDREVALLIRDRASGTPLYEARASSEGFAGMDAVLRPMFDAALAEFPAVKPQVHAVTVPLATP